MHREHDDAARRARCRAALRSRGGIRDTDSRGRPQCDDVSARFTPDELTASFSRPSSGGTYDLFMATRTSIDTPFETPLLLATVNSINSDVWPTLSLNGLLLMFDSNVTGVYRIYSSRRATLDDRFDPPRTVLALRDGEVHPMLANARAMYFASSQRTGLGGGDIWHVEVDTTGATSTPVAIVGGVNSAADEATPAITADERTIYFRRTTGSEADIFTASRSTPKDGWGIATAVPGLAMAGIGETPSWVSPDGCHLYFHADAPGGMGGLDIYVARRGN
jgi:hypothetical protein